MLKTLKVFVLGLIALSAMSIMAQDALPDLGGRTITVAVENAYIPFSFIDETTGEAQGWDYDVIDEICARLNCVPEYIETSWDGMINAVSNGEFDVAGDGITITAERAEIVDFSIGYIQVAQKLLVRLEDDRFVTVADFAANSELLIASQPGTTNFLSAVELVGEDRVLTYDSFGAVVQAVIAGDVDGAMIDDVAGQGYVGENAESVYLLEDPIASDDLGFIFQKGSDLVEPFNAAIEEMLLDGTLEEINAVWFPSGDAETDSVVPDLGGITVTVAVENAYIPFNYIDETTGEAVGWDYDVMDELCVRLNCVPEYIETSWDGMINAVANGEFDIAADGITITEERDEVVDFSIGYIQVTQKILVRVDEDRFTTIQEFVDGDFMIGTQPGTTNYDTAAELIGEDRIVGYGDFGATVQALIAGDIDAVIMDDVAGVGYAGENADSVVLLDEAITSDDLALVFTEGSELKAPFDIALQSMIDDGSLAELGAKWFTPDGGE